MDVKPLASIAAKFGSRGASAGPEYEAGATHPRRSWSQSTAAAAANYQAGIQRSLAAGSFAKGVVKAGDAKQQRGVREKGVARFGAGVAAAVPDYQTGFAPYHQALTATTLPPRRARRDPSNLQRVAAVVQAMIRTAEATK